ncbi:GNAT family N-acetyltransferase [Streptomyces sp. NPDC005529]|uniref:GNAT family N-acetyltransferase n=1 Tax=unclassified Streptomyces TaxID=2593676 RepID=UPI0033B67A47
MADGFRVRAMGRDDHRCVLALVDADRLPGQPVAGSDLLTAPSRDGLVRPVTLVLTDAADAVRGVVHCAVRTRDGAGLIGWLHAYEDFTTAAALVAVARAHLRPVLALYAGFGPTQAPASGVLHLPGIPRCLRPATTRALRAAGFTPAAGRLYFHHPLALPLLAPSSRFPRAEVRAQSDPAGVRLTLFAADGQVLAVAVLHTFDDGPWHLWHLGVRSDRRYRDVASHLLAQCLQTARCCGATGVIAHTDEDDERRAGVLQRAGFTTVDTLAVYHRRP